MDGGGEGSLVQGDAWDNSPEGPGGEGPIGGGPSGEGPSGVSL